MTNQNKINFFSSLSLACVLGTLTAGCGQRTSESQTLSTDQRPDISEDRSSVHITAGTKDFAHIYAKDLQAYVTNIPDADSDKTSTQKLTGQFIFAVAQNPRTNMVAVAVRGMLYTETDFSMIFFVNPAFPKRPQLMSFVMPGKKKLPENTTHALRSIRDLYFDDSGILHAVTTDASGSRAELLINPDATIRSCHYIEKDEGQLCGEDQ